MGPHNKNQTSHVRQTRGDETGLLCVYAPSSTMFPDTANVSIVAFIFTIVIVLLLFTAEPAMYVTHD
jgi:hypothetical protein